MKKVVPIGLVISLVLALVMYLVTGQLIYTGGIFLLSFFYFLLIAGKRIDQMTIKIERYHECYGFINNFIISLSIKGSLTAAFENGSSSLGEEYEKFIRSISDMDINEKIVYLRKYFKFHSYQLFSDIVAMWSEEGGNILEMTSYLSNQMRETEEYIGYSLSIAKRIGVEFGILWLFTLAILLVLRFSLTDFFAKFIQQKVFVLSVLVLFILIIVSIDIFLSRATKIEIGGWKNENK